MTKTLHDLGEFPLIEKIRQFSPWKKGEVGIGDDCAVIPLGRGQVQLVTSDSLVENVHFLRQKIHPFDLGHKVLAVNLSDIAAMGGTPERAYLNLSLPADLSTSWLDQFLSGLQHLGKCYNVTIVGGDTTGSPGPIFINLVLQGSMEKKYCRLRSAGRAGDILAITGRVGDSHAGLQLILRQGELTNWEIVDHDFQFLIDQHHKPTPAIREGQWLAKQSGVHSMMDVSDGLQSDLQRLTQASKVKAIVSLDKIPVSSSLKKLAKRFDWNAQILALQGGEDYCLMVSVAASSFASVARSFERQFHKPLFPIGNLERLKTGETDGVHYIFQKQKWHPKANSFGHF